MKTAITATIAVALLTTIGIVSTATASVTSDREARTATIEALYQAVRSGRLTRSETIQAKLDIARLEAEARKERRQADRIRDREAALNS